LGEDMAKDAEAEVQKVIDGYSVKIDETIVAKEKDIMTI
jgi:ribosome recycling factor